MKVWMPVDSYINQEILDFKAGGSLVIDTVISGRHVRLSDSNGAEVSTLLRPGYAVCRLTRQTDAPAGAGVPMIAMPPERVGAIMSAYMYLFDENGDAWSGSESVAEILHAMILEITGKEPEL